MNLAQYFRGNGPVMREQINGNDWTDQLFTLLIVLIIAGVAIYLIRSLVKNSSGAENSPEPVDPLDLAKQRYAKGEITKQEFTEIKKELK